MCLCVCVCVCVCVCACVHACARVCMCTTPSDIDECANTKLNNCSLLATCSNTGGGFICQCNVGFRGDGVNCASKFLVIQIVRQKSA